MGKVGTYGGKPKPKKPNALTGAQAAFVAEFLKTGNGTAAYRVLFPNANPKFVNSYAGRLLRHPNVKAAIAEQRQKVVDKGGYNLEKAHNECSELLAISVQKGQMQAAAKFFETKAKLHGLLIEKHQHSGTVPFQIVIQGVNRQALPAGEPQPIPIAAKDVTPE